MAVSAKVADRVGVAKAAAAEVAAEVEVVAPGRAPAGPQVWVVQRRVRLAPGDDGEPLLVGSADGGLWEDVAVVTMPPRSKRRAIISAAIAQSGLDVGEGWSVRALDVASALEIPVGLKVPPAELVIG